MNEAVLRDRVAVLASLSAEIHTPCHDGSLVWRRWSAPARAAQKLLLVHGGSGSWTHWFANIPHLAARYHVHAIDLPGLGDSAALPAGYTAADAVDAVAQGLPAVFGEDAFHLCAFSWGCAVSSQLSLRHPGRFLSMCLVGPASLGNLPRRGGMKPLIRRTPAMTRAEVHATNRENLARLMIHDRSRIDDMAVYLQTTNTERARFNSPQFVLQTLTLDGVAGHRVPLKVIYGAEDAPAKPDVAAKEALFRSVRPDVEFHVEPDGGHWLQYEKPGEFHALLDDWIARRSA